MLEEKNNERGWKIYFGSMKMVVAAFHCLSFSLSHSLSLSRCEKDLFVTKLICFAFMIIKHIFCGSVSFGSIRFGVLFIVFKWHFHPHSQLYFHALIFACNSIFANESSCTFVGKTIEH